MLPFGQLAASLDPERCLAGPHLMTNQELLNSFQPVLKILSMVKADTIKITSFLAITGELNYGNKVYF